MCVQAACTTISVRQGNPAPEPRCFAGPADRAVVAIAVGFNARSHRDFVTRSLAPNPPAIQPCWTEPAVHAAGATAI
jgi:hypothetical protein